MYLFLFIAILAPAAFFLWHQFKHDRCCTELGWFINGGIAAVYVVLMMILTSQCIVQIKPGEVGVVVDMLGSQKGVEDEELTVGFHFLLPWKDVYHFPIYEQNHQWIDADGFNFQTIEGLSVHADLGITYHLSPDKVHELFWRYRRGMEEITHLFVRNNIRDAINRVSSRMKIEELYGDKKEEFFTTVQRQVQGELESLGFKISHLYIIGQFKVPPMVMEALNRKIEATQKAQQRENELREAEAEARKEIAKAEGEAKSRLLKAKAEADAIYVQAEAKAKANQLLTKSLSDELIMWDMVNRWDGVMPKITGDKGMIIQLPMLGAEHGKN